jgi:hypothetical protein
VVGPKKRRQCLLLYMMFNLWCHRSQLGKRVSEFVLVNCLPMFQYIGSLYPYCNFQGSVLVSNLLSEDVFLSTAYILSNILIIHTEHRP